MVKAQGLEGVIAKRRDSLYEPGRRSGAWVKMRVHKVRDLIVGGYVANGRNSIRSLQAITKGLSAADSCSILPGENRAGALPTIV